LVGDRRPGDAPVVTGFEDARVVGAMGLQS
jgi:hypothetical protein